MTETPDKSPRVRKIATSLQWKMSRPGGAAAADLLARAQANMDDQRDQALEGLASDVDALRALCGARAPGSEPQVYALASALVDVAGLLNVEPFYEAAYSLCEVASRMEVAGAWTWPPVEVHVRALALILQAPATRSPATEHLLTGLKAVLAHTARGG